jgi:serine phosphatase RsbU (regulator of sigma subunit)
VTEQGEITLANAGHLSPYCNREEIPITSGLPLGIFRDENYQEHTITLAPGDQMTLLSDGVLEAMDAKGELFGFERTCSISAQTAAEIAAAALRFGQADDITVLTLARLREAAIRE